MSEKGKFSDMTWFKVTRRRLFVPFTYDFVWNRQTAVWAMKFFNEFVSK